MNRFVGWIYKIAEGDWGLRINASPDGVLTLVVPLEFRFASSVQALERADQYFKRDVKLQPTVNAEMGYRILNPHRRREGVRMHYECDGPFEFGHKKNVCVHGWNTPHTLTMVEAQQTDHLYNCGLLPAGQRISKVEKADAKPK